ncbi:GAF domain-containing protein [Sulfidibacter corallicola]|uniref:GAF domain-containing protein n=1 Tax=Sulfidibacter corallicola TaxID=2818388 RepID=A0A8A4TGM7_SULCO|nr:GAF domain-containing protein [Sulfidibacter corallicola]QTD48332.1 GAF domain-containing protein [Sulfidibacter corallicola]
MPFALPERLKEAGLKISSQLEPHKLAVTVLQEARLLTGADHCWFLMRRKSGYFVEAELEAGGEEVQKRALPLAAAPPPVRHVVRAMLDTKQTLMLENAKEDPRFSDLHAYQTHPTAVLTVPVLAHNAEHAVIAVIHLIKDAAEKGFETQHRAFLEHLAPLLSVTVVNAHKFQLYRKRIDKLETQLAEGSIGGDPIEEIDPSNESCPTVEDLKVLVERGREARKVLHDLGNHLNGAVLTCEEVVDMLKENRVAQLGKALEMLNGHSSNLAVFFEQEDKSRQWSEFVAKILTSLERDQEILQEDIVNLQKHLTLMKNLLYEYQSRAINNDVRGE